MDAKAKKTFRREDRPGHLDPDHVSRLLALSREEHAGTSSDANRSFVVHRERGGPDLAQRLAEGAVLAATSGQDELGGEVVDPPAGELGDTFFGSGPGRPGPEAVEPDDVDGANEVGELGLS
jgi:hypothetical protein